MPDNKTCFVLSITAFANNIGFLTLLTPATAPEFSVFPSMIEASILFLPSLSKTEPLPALNKGEFSSIVIVCCTASNEVPPFSNIVYPLFKAFSKTILYSF